MKLTIHLLMPNESFKVIFLDSQIGTASKTHSGRSRKSSMFSTGYWVELYSSDAASSFLESCLNSIGRLHELSEDDRRIGFSRQEESQR